MIAIDTNVLLRYLLNDDEEQSAKAAQLIRGELGILITDIVLVETVWTLKGKRYNLDKKTILKTIHALFAEPNIYFEEGQVVWRALVDYSNTKPVKVGRKSRKKKDADFPDALLVNKAHWIAKQKGIITPGVYTFDKAAQQLSGTLAP